MKINKFEEIFTHLKNEAKRKGYKVKPTTIRTEVDFRYKTIMIKRYIKTTENLYCFCHELGHIKEKNHNIERYRSSKYCRIYSEISAWILGYEYVKKYNLPKVGYVISACKHLRSYI